MDAAPRHPHPDGSGIPARRGTPDREPWLALGLLVAAFLGAALALALDPRWGYDEAWHLYLSSIEPWTKALEENLVDAHPPLHHLVLAPLTELGASPLWLRLPSVIAAALALVLWYRLLRTLDVAAGAALLATALLASSFGFLEVAVVVRAYSLGLLFLILGLYAAASLLAWEARACAEMTPPSRAPLLAALGFTLAFASMYATIFVTAALTLSLLVLAPTLVSKLVPGLPSARVSPVRLSVTALAVILMGHAGTALWFAVGYGRGRGAIAPEHVTSLTLADGQPIGAFIWQGLLGNTAWIFPQTQGNDGALALTTIAFWALVLLLGWRYVAQGRRDRAVLVATLPAATGLVAVAGIVGVYPFGGMIRHQIILLPLYLLVLGFLLDELWRQAPSRAWRILLVCATLTLGAFGLYRAQSADPLGEGETQRDASAWMETVLERAGPGSVIYLPGQLLYPATAEAHSRGRDLEFLMTLGLTPEGPVVVPHGTGWLGGLSTPRDLDVFASGRDPGAPLFIRDRRRWSLGSSSEPGLAEALSAAMSHLKASESWLLLTPDPEGGPLQPPMPQDGLASRCLAVGQVSGPDREGVVVLRVHRAEPCAGVGPTPAGHASDPSDRTTGTQK